MLPSTQSITVVDAAAGASRNKQQSWEFGVNDVLVDASQEDVFARCAKDIVDGVLEGYNGTVLAYGQTGAGKTHTMTGGATGGYANRGLVPRAVSYVFRQLEAAEAAGLPPARVRVSYLEIYNESLFDLLQGDGVGASAGDLAVFEDRRGRTHVKGLTMRAVSSEEDALNLLFDGEAARAIAEHQLNQASTRSHCVFTVYVHRRGVAAEDELVSSKLHLVDLAGSERVSKTASSGKTLDEAKYINKSLTFLEQVVMALIDKRRDHVPYRSSKLTNVLKDSLGGNCRTRMIACVWPETVHREETLATLRFSSRMMMVTTTPSVNVERASVAAVAKYEKEILHLRQELAMHDVLAGRSGVKYGALGEEEHNWVAKTMQAYVAGHIDAVKFSTMREIQAAFEVMRTMVRAGGDPAAVKPVSRAIPAAPAGGSAAGSAGAAGEDSADGAGAGAGGAPTTPSGAAAAADDDAMWDEPVRRHTGFTPRADVDDGAGAADSTPNGRVFSGALLPDDLPDPAEEFAKWKAGAGASVNSEFLQAKSALKDAKTQMKRLAAEVNKCKAAIDSSMQLVAQCDATDTPSDDATVQLKTAKKVGYCCGGGVDAMEFVVTCVVCRMCVYACVCVCVRVCVCVSLSLSLSFPPCRRTGKRLNGWRSPNPKPSTRKTW